MRHPSGGREPPPSIRKSTSGLNRCSERAGAGVLPATMSVWVTSVMAASLKLQFRKEKRYRKFPQKRWMRPQASSRTLSEVA